MAALILAGKTINLGPGTAKEMARLQDLLSQHVNALNPGIILVLARQPYLDVALKSERTLVVFVPVKRLTDTQGKVTFSFEQHMDDTWHKLNDLTGITYVEEEDLESIANTYDLMSAIIQNLLTYWESDDEETAWLVHKLSTMGSASITNLCDEL